MEHQEITYFAETDFRGKKTRFGIKTEDRSRHVYVIGKTGMGKSTMLENMAVQDIQNGHGMAFIDPHGGTAEKLLDYVPESRINDVIYLAPFDLEYPISFNVMEDIGKDQRHLVVNGLMSAFKKIWVDAWSARMEYILQNTLLALLEYPGSTLLGVNRMLSDKEYRNKVVANIEDPSVRSFWVDEFANYTERMAAEAVPAIQNKIGQFTANPLIRNIIGQPKSSFDFRKVMDDKKILIINLSKGRIGESNANLLGSMIITKIYLAAMSRANVPAPILRTLPPFYFFVDEFQSFANESFANILSEARKYKLSLTIAHQYIEQMSEEVRAAVFGNVGTIVSFRVGPFDAEIFERIFSPTFMKEDMVNLGFAQVYLTLMIDGVGSPPFSALTLPPIVASGVSAREAIIAASRQHYARARAVIEAEIVAWHETAKSRGAPVGPIRDGRPGGRPGPAAARPPRREMAAPPRPLHKDSVVPAAPPDQPGVTMKAAIAKALTDATGAKTPPAPTIPLTKVVQPSREPSSTLSLAQLRDKSTSEKSTGKHSADLRAVLQSVQADLRAALPPKNPASPTGTPRPASATTTLPPTPPIAPANPKEIPEEQLRRLLKT